MRSPISINNTIDLKQIVVFSKYRNWGILFVFLLSITNTFCQQKQFQFSHLTTDDGLSNSQVVSILQDYRGFMWFGTYNGLNRYDGTNFVVYRNIESDSTSILGSLSKSIYEDPQKRLYIGTFDGLCLYNRDLDCFRNFKSDKSSILYGITMPIFRITGDSKGNLWLASSEGLFFFDPNNNKMIHYKHDPNKPGSISDNFLENVLLDSKGRLWISTHKGIDLMNEKTREFEHITYCITHNDTLKASFQNTAIEDKDGNIWFGGDDGLFCFENKLENNKKGLIHYKNDPNDPNSLSHNYVVSFYIDDARNLWIGTENGGINLFNKENKTFSHLRHDDFNPKSLNNESIWAITQDRNKNYWIGTFGGGINISVKNSDFIVHYKNLPGAELSLGHNIVKGFLEDNKGRKWIATDGGGLNLFNDKTDRFLRFNTTNSKLSSNAVLCLEQGENDQIWIGTWAGGLVNYNTKTNTFKSFTTKNSGISDNNIHTIAKDKKRRFMDGVSKRRINKLQSKGK